MIKIKKVKPLPKSYLESIGFVWHTDSDGSDYVADELVVVTPKEANGFYEAANELYDMFVEAGEYVIENNLFFEIGVPFNLVEAIKRSWEEDEKHWHIYSRFDLAGGIDGRPIKLLEFNADTPTALFETAIIQWAILKYNGLDEAKQFNRVYEAIKENFERVLPFFGAMLFSSMRTQEDENTTRLLQTIASEAGFETKFCFVDEVGFAPEAIGCEEEDFLAWFKLVPWEMIAIEEPELALLLNSFIKNKGAVYNPAYTLMFQSKGMLKILWDLFKGHPLLLETSFEPLKDRAYVKKPFFGREGGNVAIFDTDGSVLSQRDGEYGNFGMVYQEFVELPKDSEGRYYQAGLFFAYEGCGLGFRRGDLIIDNLSKFVGHIIEP